MIAISMSFLAGRFHATPWERHVNESGIEYPPSSWRFLRALVATFYRARPDDMTEEQLTRILTTLSTPPSFHLPRASIGHTRHYDIANKSKHFFDTFVAINPTLSLVWLWTEATLDAAERAVFVLLLERLGTFGRAESWCEVRLLEEFDISEANSWLYVEGQSLESLETMRVLVPQDNAENLLSSLCNDTGKMRKEKRLSPPDGAEWVTYVRSKDTLSEGLPAKKSSSPNTSANVTIVRFALDSNVLPLVQDTLPFCETVRWAILDFRRKLTEFKGAPFSEVLTGKEADERTPLKGHAHAHYLATDEDGDGRLDHVTIYAPRGFDQYDLDALGNLREIYRHGETHKVFAVLVGIGEVGDFAATSRRSTNLSAPTLQSARRWRSVTPFVLPRFATRGEGKGARPRDTPEAQLRREIRLRKELPEVVAVEEVKGYQAEGRPFVRWLEFKTRRFNGSTGYGVAGFEIEFAEEMSAPLALGFGCHFGLGLFEAV